MAVIPARVRSYRRTGSVRSIRRIGNACAIPCALPPHTRSRHIAPNFGLGIPGVACAGLLSVGRVERAPDGAPQRLLGISLDITSRKQMEEALRKADRRK